MTKRQFSLLLGLVGQAGCLVYDDALRREASDVEEDAPRDSGVVARDAREAGVRSDAVTLEAEASRDAALDTGVRPDVAIGEDARDATPPGADAGDDARDGFGAPSDASSSDALLDADADTGDVVFGDASHDRNDGLVDAAGDPPILGCSVDFTVSGVAWEGGATEDSGAGRSVRLVGDIGSLGAWVPEAGRAMAEKAPGAWSTSVVLYDRLTIEFKFVKVQSGSPPEWEQWPPFDSNRSFLIDCGADGGTVWVDAATEAGPASRAVGKSYGGAFGVRPLDATK